MRLNVCKGSEKSGKKATRSPSFPISYTGKVPSKNMSTAVLRYANLAPLTSTTISAWWKRRVRRCRKQPWILTIRKKQNLGRKRGAFLQMFTPTTVNSISPTPTISTSAPWPGKNTSESTKARSSFSRASSTFQKPLDRSGVAS